MMFSFYIAEGICFAAFVAFVARGYTMQFFSEADSFRNIRGKHHTHLKMAM
jgi:hypothetical protein